MRFYRVIGLLWGILCCGGIQSAVAQELDLTGMVYDFQTYTRPENVTVSLEGPEGIKTATVNPTGQYTFPKCKPGKYKIRLEAPEYNSFEKTFEIGTDYSWMAELAMVRLTKKGAKIRTRVVDYTRYDQLNSAWAYATDKARAVEELLNEVNRLFTPEDEEYFLAYSQAGMVYSNFVKDIKRAIRYYEQASDAYQKHAPFYNRSNIPMVNDEMVVNMISSGLGNVYLQYGMSASAIQVMQTYKPMMAKAGNLTRISYLLQLSNAYLLNEDYEACLREAEGLKGILESGQPIIARTKIEYRENPDDPESVRKMLRKQYLDMERRLDSIYARSDEMTGLVYSSQYNRILGMAHYNQYQFKEASNYLNKYNEQQRRYQELIRVTQAQSMSQTSGLADSIVRNVKESLRYTELVNSIGHNPQAVIATLKSGVESVPISLLDKAVWFQMKGRYAESEKIYADMNKRLTEMESMKFYVESSNIYKSKLVNPYYHVMLCAAKKYPLVITRLEADFQKLERELQVNFSYFSEDQRKEYFNEYTRQLDFYYSVLLAGAESDASLSLRILDKSLQTKGLILEVTREQDRRLRNIRDPEVKAMVAKVRQLRDKLVAFKQLEQQSPGVGVSDSINRLTVYINRLDRTINDRIGSPGQLIKPVTWKSIQTKLKPEEALLEIVRVERNQFTFDAPLIQYWGFIIKSTGDPVPFLLGSGQGFEERSLKNYQNQVRFQLEDPTSYSTYWKAVADRTVGIKNLLLSADGVYHLINPATLLNPASGKYVMDEIQITTMSAGRDLLVAHAESKSSGSFVLIGNPDFEMSRITSKRIGEISETLTPVTTRAGMAPLPGAELEVEQVSDLARSAGVKTDVLIGQAATESVVKKISNPVYLHLATHGAFQQKKGADVYLKSMLLLAGASDNNVFTLSDYNLFEDGLLTAFEVTQMNLQETKLVVLSACETGLGEIQSGEGVWGLQRAFQLAGARQVLGSLWKISDEATVVFMQHFYSNYLQKGKASEAYQVAMTATRKQYPHPYYWGAFQLVGN